MKYNKRYVVAGADGFIGSHLVELLVENGYAFWALCQYNSFNHWGWIDIGQPDQLKQARGEA